MGLSYRERQARFLFLYQRDPESPFREFKVHFAGHGVPRPQPDDEIDTGKFSPRVKDHALTTAGMKKDAGTEAGMGHGRAGAPHRESGLAVGGGDPVTSGTQAVEAIEAMRVHNRGRSHDFTVPIRPERNHIRARNRFAVLVMHMPGDDTILEHGNRERRAIIPLR